MEPLQFRVYVFRERFEHYEVGLHLKSSTPPPYKKLFYIFAHLQD